MISIYIITVLFLAVAAWGMFSLATASGHVGSAGFGVFVFFVGAPLISVGLMWLGVWGLTHFGHDPSWASLVALPVAGFYAWLVGPGR